MTSWISFTIWTVLLCGFHLTSSRDCSTFRASVYEHVVHIPVYSYFITVTRKQALRNMMKNLRVYKQQAIIAASKKADILVFPEDGIYGMLFTRQTIKPYLEYIPDPQHTAWNPCTDPARFEHTDVQRMLSCMARDNALYIVANMGDRQPCDGEQCPDDGQHQYNTNVVYDDGGNLVARYHKTHLFKEQQFDRPNETEFVTFDAPFGRFGVFTCYDILFKKPAVELVKRYGVSNFVFPTAWGDELPHLSAIGFHSSFARGMKVNVLAANIHLPIFRMLGSGIYTPDGAVAYYYDDSIFSSGKLIFGDICSSNLTNSDNVTHTSDARHLYSSVDKTLVYAERNRINVANQRHGYRKTKQARKIIVKNMKRDRSALALQRLGSHNDVLSATKFKRLFKSLANNQYQWTALQLGLSPLTSSSTKPRPLFKPVYQRYISTPQKRSFRTSTLSKTKTVRLFKPIVNKQFILTSPKTRFRTLTSFRTKPTTRFIPIAYNQLLWASLKTRSRNLTSTAQPTTLFKSAINNNFHWTPLKSRFGTLKSCIKKTCCFLKYELDDSSPSRRELFAFGIYNGYDDERYTQVCTVVKCLSHSLHSCGRRTKTARTRFKHIRLGGQFSSSYIFPQVVVSQRGGIGLDDSSWVYSNGSILSKKGTSAPVLVVSLLARVYRLDKTSFL